MFKINCMGGLSGISKKTEKREGQINTDTGTSIPMSPPPPMLLAVDQLRLKMSSANSRQLYSVLDVLRKTQSR